LLRNLLLVAIVWALLYGVAETLDVMPEMRLPFASRVDEAPAPEAPPEGDSLGEEVDADEADDAEAHEVAVEDAVAEESPAEPDVEEDAPAGVCEDASASPRVFAARLPSGAPALLVDCGGHAELLVPELERGRATTVARLAYAAPLLRVESKDLTSDGRPDLAFAFPDRLVLLPTNALGVWAEPTALEGWAGASQTAEARPEGPSEVVIERVTYRVEPRLRAFGLVAEPREGEARALVVEPAALFYRAQLR